MSDRTRYQWSEEVLEAQREAAIAVDRLCRAVVRCKADWGSYDHLEDRATGAKIDMPAEMDAAMMSNFVVAAEYQDMNGDTDDTFFVAAAPSVKASTKIGLASMMLDEFSS